MYTVMLSAGEASGDLHGAGIATALKKIAPDIRLLGMGGQAMRQAGVDIRYDIAEYSVMGFLEVVKNLPRLFKLRDNLVDIMRREKPDILVIIDYPDFNLRLAKCAKQLGIPVFSYIPPSAWAWRQGRAKQVAALADQIAAIFPFEMPVYEAAGAKIAFVGNPLVEMVSMKLDEVATRQYFDISDDQLTILLLPGSRRQEVMSLLPVMLEAAVKFKESYPKAQFFLPVASTISTELLEPLLSQYNVKVKLVNAHVYELMHIADAAIATSGTVTLEAALAGLPSVVVYKMAQFSYSIARCFIKIPNVSLPNIIAGERIIPELLQSEVTASNVVRELSKLLPDNPTGQEVRQKLYAIKTEMGPPGAATRTAELILATIQQSSNKQSSQSI